MLAGFGLLPRPIVPADYAAGPDAELIGLCDRLLHIQADDRRLCSQAVAPACPGDDPAIGPQLAALDAEYDVIMGRLATMRPTTLAGTRALARVALDQAGWASTTDLQHGDEWEQPIRHILERLTLEYEA